MRHEKLNKNCDSESLLTCVNGLYHTQNEKLAW
jgi:hypothetical protein